jgi:hypothetical protein
MQIARTKTGIENTKKAIGKCIWEFERVVQE